VREFLQEALSLLPTHWQLRCIRADSGFFADALLTYLEDQMLPHIVVAKMTLRIKSKLRHCGGWRHLDATYSVSEFTAKL
jgi:hypothetical protein